MSDNRFRRTFLSAALAASMAAAAAASEPGTTQQMASSSQAGAGRSQVLVTGTCGEGGFVGEITNGVTTARFRSCVRDGVVRATFMDGGGKVLAEYETVVAGKGADRFHISGIAFDPEGDMPPAAQAGLLELMKLPAASLLSALPDRLLEMGFCEQRPAFAAVLGLGFLVGGGE